MEKVKPVLPPKPKCSSPSQIGRVKRLDPSGCPVKSTSCSDVGGSSVTRDELNGSSSPEESLANGEKPMHMATSLSLEDICHGLAKPNVEAQEPRQRPRTAPKPKSCITADSVVEEKSVSSMIPTHLVADVIDCTDSNISLEGFSPGKVSATVAGLQPANQMKTPPPVKPPRPKKDKKQTSLFESDASDVMHEFPPENHDDKKKQSRPVKAETKPKPKLFVNVLEPNDSLTDRGKSSPASADSGRLYRSASYERALEDDIFGSGVTEAGHLKDNEKEEGQKKKTDTVLSDVKASVSESDISVNYLGPEPVKDVTVVSKERVLENVQDLPLLNRKGNGSIYPIRLAPPPPSKANAPILKRIPKNPEGLKGVAPSEYMDLQSKSIRMSDASVVKRSTSDCIGKKSLPTGKAGQAKQKLRKKSGDGEKGKSESVRQSESVFYVNLSNSTSDLNEENVAIDKAPLGENKTRVDSDDYLLPTNDSQTVSSSEGYANSPSFYQNTRGTTPNTKMKNPSISSLDTIIPAPGKTREPVEEMEPDNISTNTYYEINELDLPVHIEDGTLDEEGYSMIAENNSNANKDNGEDADTDYIYPEHWENNSQPSRLSDTYIYPVDEECKAFSPKSGEKFAAVVRPRTITDLSLVCEEGDSRPSSWVCDSAFQSPACSSSLSRSSSALSNSTYQTTDASSPSELTEEDIKKSAEQRKRKAFLTAQEIVTSEKTFVDVLRLLSQDFMAAMNQAGASLGKPVVPNSVLCQIIKYLPELQRFNEELLEDLTSRLKNWERDPRVADIFVKKGAFLKLYTNYIREFNSMVALLDDNRRKNPDFDRAVTEFESKFCPVEDTIIQRPNSRLSFSPKNEATRCAKLALKHYMLKPIQRIPQYRLLLTDYRKQLSEDSPDFKDANTAILIVNEVAEHANESMKYGDNLNKLLEIQNSLIGQFEVIVPGRALLKEGILMKLSRKEMQPRMFYLFTDVLLYTTPVGSGSYKLNNVLPLNTVKVNNPAKEDFQNEFSIISTQRSFTVSARTEQEKVEWLDAMFDALSKIRMKRTSYVKGKQPLPSIVSIDIDPMDFKLGAKAPVWIPDDRVSMCMICKQEFSLLFRRHHCRCCGKVVCATCSSYEAPLRYLLYKPERVCSECFVTLGKMIDEMDDVLTEEDTVSAQGEQVAELNRFTKRSIKSNFRSFAVDKESPKYVPPKRPAVLQEVNANDENAEMSGYLHLWKDKKWKKTWFVLKEKVLYTFKASEDAAAEKSTPLLGYEITPFNTYFQGIEPNLLFELCHRGMPSIIFRTESPQSRDRWMSAMRSATMP